MADHINNFSSSQTGVPAITASITLPDSQIESGSHAVHATAQGSSTTAIWGEHKDLGHGVFGLGGPVGGIGVFGVSRSLYSGVFSKNSGEGDGVFGESVSGKGVRGQSQIGPGVNGFSGFGLTRID